MRRNTNHLQYGGNSLTKLMYGRFIMKEMTRELNKIYKKSLALDAEYKSLVKHKELLKLDPSSQEILDGEEIIDNLPKSEFMRELNNSYKRICATHALEKLLFQNKFISRHQFEICEKLHKTIESINKSIEEIENQ